MSYQKSCRLLDVVTVLSKSEVQAPDCIALFDELRSAMQFVVSALVSWRGIAHHMFSIFPNE